MKVQISKFLKERESRIKPAEANKMGLKRLNKIDFSGEMHLVNKPTNTDMILIKKGDLVISGINVEKGAVAVYQDKEDILATIHYSAYIFDETKIDIEYFKTFLKSKAFRDVINSQIRSGIKTELKASKFLSLEINLPELETQKKIRDKINLSSNKISELSNIDNKNENYIIKLKQQILQEAVKGKLVKQDSKDEPASELLKKISNENKLPFDIPKNWILCQLKDISEYIQRGKGPDYAENTNIPVISQKCIQWKGFDINRARFITLKSFENYDKVRLLQNGDLLWNSTGDGTIGRICAYYEILNPYKKAVVDSHVTIIRLNKKYVFPKYALIWLSSKFVQDELEVSGSTKQTELSTSTVKSQQIPLPPLSEQKRIVEKVDKLMIYCDELEKQIIENQGNNEKLIVAVLKESFEK
jgi:type I restriction enzyme S subunit